jgi:uncharacterized membrane protein
VTPRGVSDLRALWSRLRESLWFVPALIVLAAIGLAVSLVELSAAVGDPAALARWPRVFGVGADGSRSMLSAIATSMITVAGVTFSITTVAVTQVSTQYSPRVLRNFMRDRVNQSVLGVFVGIFVYCLVVLRTIRGGDEGAFVPSLAVLMGVVLAMVGVGVLIYFVHHVATILQAGEIVARIARDTRATLDGLYPEEGGAEEEPGASDAPPPGTGGLLVPAPATGYLQAIDIERLVRLAVDGDFLIRLRHDPGDFLVEAQPVAACERPRAASDGGGGWPLRGGIAELASPCFRVGTYRSFDQDAAFGLRQLVDVAVKALSPGINDTTTAVTCVDYLSALLVQLCNRRFGLDHRDREGVVRVRASGPRFEGFLALAMDEIRQHARGNVSVLGRQLDALALVGGVTRDPERRREVLRNIELVRAAAVATARTGPDLDGLEERARRAAAALRPV